MQDLKLAGTQGAKAEGGSVQCVKGDSFQDIKGHSVQDVEGHRAQGTMVETKGTARRTLLWRSS